MKWWNHLTRLREDPSQAWDYIEGSARQYLYDKGWYFLLFSETIKEYKDRRDSKAEECYFLGECKHCGCRTPDVFFASRACKSTPACYQTMKPRYKKLWEIIRNFPLKIWKSLSLSMKGRKK